MSEIRRPLGGSGSASNSGVAAGTSGIHPVAHAAPSDLYIVKPHDTIFTIAARFHIGAAALLEANPQIDRRTRALFVGDRLRIPRVVQAAEGTGAKPKWLELALQEARGGGRGGGYYRSAVGMWGENWCSIFMNWVMRQSGVRGSSDAMARSWLNWGVELRTPAPGAVAILSDGKLNVPGYEGNPWFHVAMFVSGRASSFEAVGGNQPNVSVMHFRAPKVIQAKFRWPKGVPLPG